MAAAATRTIKERRRNLFILDLTALVARFRNLSSFGCKAAGGKVLLFYRVKSRVGKKPGEGKDGRTGTCGRLESKFVKRLLIFETAAVFSLSFSNPTSPFNKTSCLMAEVAHSGEEHGQAEAVSGFNDLGIAL